MNATDRTFHSRRAFLKNGALILVGAGLAPGACVWAEDQRPGLRVGLITDLHYADKPPAGTRHYRETLAKLEQAGRQFEKSRPDFIVELGDLIDAADSVDTEKRYLKRIQREFQTLPGKKHYVLGNHCVDTLTKEEFLGGVEQKTSYYSFDAGGFHFVVLDACFRSDGKPYGRKNSVWTDANIPQAEQDWLAGDLNATRNKAIVFAHQRLDVSNNHAVKNAKAVRKVLEESGKVLAVFQGHSHKNDHKEIAGIHYCVLKAMVEGTGLENNGFSLMEIANDGTIRLSGFQKQQSYHW